MVCRVICISRTLAAGGEEIARGVCQRMGFRYVDEEIVDRAAAKANIEPRDVAEAEHRQSLVARIIDAMGASPAIEMMGMPPAFLDPAVYTAIAASTHSPAYLTHEHYRALLQEVIRETAEGGSVVIVAHAAAMALPVSDTVLRVFVTASSEVRAARLERVTAMTAKKARQEVARSDKDRRHYFKQFYDIKEELPTHYDLVINTDQIDLERATELVIAAAGGSSVSGAGQ
jgi:cytidylate kinase